MKIAVKDKDRLFDCIDQIGNEVATNDLEQALEEAQGVVNFLERLLKNAEDA